MPGFPSARRHAAREARRRAIWSDILYCGARSSSPASPESPRAARWRRHRNPFLRGRFTRRSRIGRAGSARRAPGDRPALRYRDKIRCFTGGRQGAPQSRPVHRPRGATKSAASRLFRLHMGPPRFHPLWTLRLSSRPSRRLPSARGETARARAACRTSGRPAPAVRCCAAAIGVHQQRAAVAFGLHLFQVARDGGFVGVAVQPPPVAAQARFRGRWRTRLPVGR